MDDFVLTKPDNNERGSIDK